MTVLGLIPARGGSKGIPRKNLRRLKGQSLLERTFECAVASGVVDRLILSTDDAEIARHAEELGLEVPFMRPAEYATDESPMIDVAQHALRWYAEQGESADMLMTLQPTSPLRKPEHLRRAMEMIGDHDSVCAVVPIPLDICPHRLMKVREDGLLDFFLPEGAGYSRRQDVPPAYKRDGTVYLTRVEVIRAGSFHGDRCVPMRIERPESLSIDLPEDWARAELLLGD